MLTYLTITMKGFMMINKWKQVCWIRKEHHCSQECSQAWELLEWWKVSRRFIYFGLALRSGTEPKHLDRDRWKSLQMHSRVLTVWLGELLTRSTVRVLLKQLTLLDMVQFSSWWRCQIKPYIVLKEFLGWELKSLVLRCMCRDESVWMRLWCVFLFRTQRSDKIQTKTNVSQRRGVSSGPIQNELIRLWTDSMRVDSVSSCRKRINPASYQYY